MTGRQSAGVLLFRRTSGQTEVLLGHMGGPFWARKDAGAWSLPKGEPNDGEELVDAARREFGEELGVELPAGPLTPLGAVRQSGGKTVTAWALEADLDLALFVPGSFEMEWPPRSGRLTSFPELDRVRWIDLDTAHGLLVAAQSEFLTRLIAMIAADGSVA